MASSLATHVYAERSCRDEGSSCQAAHPPVGPTVLGFNTLLILLSTTLIISHSQQRCEAQRPLTRTVVFEGHGSSHSSQVVADLRAQNEALLKHRVAYGEMHCKFHGIGPTGGFCVNGTNDVGGNTAWDRPFCTQLAKLYAGKSVLDMGCGLGHYGKCLSAANTDVKWLTVDGSEGIERATGGFVKFMDLSLPQHLNQQYDWVMSLEVGEHLPKQYEQVLFGNIARHAKEGVVLTWATPGQGGHAHVNEQTNEYVIEKMVKLGFQYDAERSQALRAAAVLAWFKNTIMVFVRQ